MTTSFRQSFRVAITTKFLGPTNHRGSRVVATSGNGHRLTVAWDHALGIPENHAAAAKALADKMEWDGEWFGGGTDNGYVFVNLPRAERPDPDNYYAKALDGIAADGAATVKFLGKTTETKWLSLNAESANAIRAFLAKLGF